MVRIPLFRKLVLFLPLLLSAGTVALAQDPVQETRLESPLAFDEGAIALRVVGAWSLGRTELVLVRDPKDEGAAPRFIEGSNKTGEPQPGKAMLETWEGEVLEVELDGDGAVKSAFLWNEAGFVAVEKVTESTVVLTSKRPLPPFWQVPEQPPSPFCGSQKTIYLYSEWVGGCLIDVYGCSGYFQNQVRVIACCDRGTPGEGGRDCQSLGVPAAS